MSFADYKNKNKSSLEELQKSLEASKQVYKEDERFWFPVLDKSGSASAIIRLLPPVSSEVCPWVKIYSHGFQNPVGGAWFIEQCPTSLPAGQCPVCKKNGELWATGLEENKATVRKRSRRTTYLCNVLVLNNPSRPEDNGQVRLFKFRESLMKLILNRLSPEKELLALNPNLKPQNVFSLFEDGSALTFIIKKKDGFCNYESSTFNSPSALYGGDESKLAAVYDKIYPLQPFLAADQFKPYDKLLERWNKVMGDNSASVSTKAATTTPKKVSVAEVVENTPSDEGDTALSYFESLVK